LKLSVEGAVEWPSEGNI